MTSDKKQEYTLRISEANKSGTIVILYDMFQTYLEDAELASENAEELHQAIRRARAVLMELIESLSLEYEIAQNLYKIYRYVDRLLIRTDVRLDVTPLKDASRLMGKLRNAYAEVSKEDTSPSIMENTEYVYAGMTYGKGELHESNVGSTSNRGFLA